MNEAVALTDPLHTTGGLTTDFANVNSAEAWGGAVASPLGWTFFRTATEAGMRRGLRDFGALRKEQLTAPADRNLCFLNIFYGRPGSNVALWRAVMDHIWGASGAGYVETYHAGTGEGAAKRRAGSTMSLLRFLYSASRGMASLAWYRRRLLRWWQASVRPGTTHTLAGAQAKFAEAARYNRLAMRPHSHVSWTGQSLLEQLKGACRAAGHPGLELELIATDGHFEEQGLIADTWAVSRDRQTLTRFITRWGFQGPVVGELSSHSWREDSSPLLPVIAAYRAKPDTDDPSRVAGRSHAARRPAMTKLLAGSPRRSRWRLRLLVRAARTYIPLRQVGRSTFLKTYDVARCMARRIGAIHVESGLLDNADDVFFLTDAELLAELPANVKELVRFRRERSDHYRTIELPERWTGELTADMVRTVAPKDAAPVGDRPRHLEGLGVSVGIVEGRAVVIAGPDDVGDLQPGDILVCTATDPSWAAVFYAVDALVTDVGAQMSHGAIVARELGIPAVVNTRTATTTLRTGDRIRVDGTAGTVDLLGAGEPTG
jgi:pyruvate,water dikinase